MGENPYIFVFLVFFVYLCRQMISTMKKLLGLMALCLGVGACEVRVSENGDFDGLWQLTAIDSLQSGYKADMHTSGEYWAVQVHLLEVRNMKGKHENVLFRFNFVGDSLLLRSPYFDESGENGELPEHEVENLKPYGIDRSDQSYRVYRLDSDNMVLDKEDVRLSFRKY